MTLAPGTYFFKDHASKRYVLVINGEKVGEVATKKEATKWWQDQSS
jgi:hypothetical protein